MDMRGCVCPECGGTGKIDNVTDEGVRDFIRGGWAGRRAKDMLAVYHEWKQTGRIPCRNCRGKGEVMMPLRWA